MCQVAARVCGVEGCGGRHYAKGMCDRCYKTALNRAKGMRPKRQWGRPLAETHPELAADLVDQTLAGKVTAGTGKRLRWKCKSGHEWEAIGGNRAKGSGCPFCANIKVMPGFNDMATTHPELAAELVGDATKVIAGTPKKLRWKCKLGHKWQAFGSNRAKGIGCPQCAESGYNPAKPGVFYLIRRPGQFKYGISNHGATRLKKHARNGWSVIETLDGPGAMVLALESAIDAAMKAKGIPTGSQAFREPFDGYTESWNANDLEVTSIQGLANYLGVDLGLLAGNSLAA